MLEDAYHYAIYNVEDGSIEIVEKTEEDDESIYVGIYYPVE